MSRMAYTCTGGSDPRHKWGVPARGALGASSGVWLESARLDCWLCATNAGVETLGDEVVEVEFVVVP